MMCVYCIIEVSTPIMVATPLLEARLFSLTIWQYMEVRVLMNKIYRILSIAKQRFPREEISKDCR